jgi:hypothetical protein
VKDIDFWVDFVAGNSNKFTKIIGFGRKNQLSHQYVPTWPNGTGYTSYYK